MNSNIQYFSTTRIAKLHNIKASPDLFDYLIYLQYQLTKIGVELGGIYQSNNKNESWVAWRDDCLDNIINDLKESINNNRKTINQEILIINNVEVKYIYQNDDIEDLIYIIVCTIKNEENIYYELNQQIIYNNVAEKLIEKIQSKGIIDPRYWKSKEMENYNNYFSDHDYDYDDYEDNNYSDESEDDDPRVVNGQIYLSDSVWINKEDAWF